MSDDEAFNAALGRLAAQMNEPGVQEWRAIRKEAGQTLDLETADVTWWYAQTADPYGVCAEFPAELDCFGREYFARSGGSKIWVAFGDLTKAAVERLWQRIEAGEFDKSSRGQHRSRLPMNAYGGTRQQVGLALRCFSETTYMEIEECSLLPDGRIQFIVNEHRP